jgi:DNA mismatch endonuclease, patch repair protein
MTDVHSPAIRSKNMTAIKSKNTKIEILVFHEFAKRHIYFRKHYKTNGINIDIAVPSKKKGIFIDGDFWHGYQFAKLKHRLPKKYWIKKIEKNIKRDKKSRLELTKLGWKILRVWEHELKNDQNKVLDKIIKFWKSK